MVLSVDDININIQGNKINGKGRAPLRFQFTYNRTRFIIGAMESCKTTGWNTETQLATRKESTSGELNKILIRKKDILVDIITDMNAKGISVTQQSLRKLFKVKCDLEFNGIEPPKNKSTGKPKSFFDALQYYKVNTKNSNESVRKWNQIESHLYDFKSDFDFSDLSEDFYNRYFLDHLVNIPLTDNTIDKHIAQIKMLCNYSIKRFPWIAIPLAYNDFKRVNYTPFRLSLSWEEVQKIEAYQPLDEKHKLAQDLFLISCYTGLRWQNASQLKPNNFVQEGDKTYLQIVTYKTGKPLRFALSQKVLSILEGYNFDIPKDYNSKINERIQLIARACDLKENVSFMRLIKGQPTYINMEKWKAVTMHVARHTFSCEFLRRNKDHGLMALKYLSEQLNHSSTKVTEIYWKMISDEKDEVLLNTFS